jgi:hypothetical protein
MAPRHGDQEEDVIDALEDVLRAEQDEAGG